MEDVIIIGAGLSGLSTAYNLKKRTIRFKILEAQSATGGRIKTVFGKQNTPMEMGATWFSKEHQNLIQLTQELNIGYFEQHNEGTALFETMSFEPPQKYFIPANTHSAYRIKGGSYRIIEELQKQLAPADLIFNTEIIKIVDNGATITITDSLHNNFYCKQLIIAVPPKLIINSVQFSPPLPQDLYQVMLKTQTWMSGSTKFAVEYKDAFWKKNGYSGSVYSQSGLACEIYDHCNFEENKFAIKGFLNGSASNYTFEERKEKVIKQLVHYFGEEAQAFESYNDKIWNDKYLQPSNDTFLPPHFNNGHRLFEDNYMNNKLFFTGTEVSPQFSGYMEGAIIAAKSVATRISKIIEK